MKKYIGTKQIEAEPMTLGEAFEKGLLQAGRVPNESEEGNAGYHVKYKDGYESWSPAGPFENTYKVADTALDRILIEGVELNDRLRKLKNFILTEKFEELDSDSKAMLFAQVGIMQEYRHIINLRYAKMEGGMVNCSNLYFGTAITLLSAGFAIRRKGWNGKGLFVVKQVPAHITEEIIPKMQSLPQSAKDLILKGKGFIDYTSQCLIYNENTGRADSWVPSISDVFAEDWEIVE